MTTDNVNINLFYKTIKKYIPKEYIYRKDILRLTYGADASLYRMIPSLVIKAKDEYQIQLILRYANDYNVSVTFRAAGTSLSGQSVTNSVLVLINDGWDNIQISDDHSKIRMQCGVIGSQANDILFPYNKKIGPDPASLSAAMIGGIVANNASGMRCGVRNNSYNTISGLRIILYDGTLLDTTDDQSIKSFKRSHATLINSLLDIRKRITINDDLKNKIIKKYSIKNTNGYSLNSFLDYDDPIDILKHLMIGSEGSLGFISDVELNTVPINKYSAISLVFFKSIKEACRSIMELDRDIVSAGELMSRHALRSVECQGVMPYLLHELPDNASAILLETSADTINELHNNIYQIKTSLTQHDTLYPVEFSDDIDECMSLWRVREGLSVSNSNVGDTAIGEDIAVHIEHLPEVVVKLQAILDKYEYHNAIVFGHALDGNIHFDFTQNFGSDDEILRYKHMMDEVCNFVVKDYDGSLKAEHGTGRNMAPYLRFEWGDDAYDIMKKVKNILDPNHILNNGVVINEDPEIHLKNMKPITQTNPIIDDCIECGFCERFCPSHKLTLSPRQRIVALRELARLRSTNENPKKIKQLKKDYSYYGEKTCATDGLCEINCPVSINTGNMTKEIRRKNKSYFQKRLSSYIAIRFALTANIVSKLLTIKDNINTTKLIRINKIIAATIYAVTHKRIPVINSYFPKRAINDFANINVIGHEDKKIIYFPSCVSRIMGPPACDTENEPLPSVVVRVMNKCGYHVIIPDNIDQLCCGTPFESKGFIEQAEYKAKELHQALDDITEGGQHEVVFDTSPCAYRMKKYTSSSIKIYDPVEFAFMKILDVINIKYYNNIAIHATCSTRKYGDEHMLINVAQKCAENIIFPLDVYCCGFAGDRGMYYPELTTNALKRLSDQVQNCQAGFSTSRTCEIGLSQSGSIDYKSIYYMIDKCISK